MQFFYDDNALKLLPVSVLMGKESRGFLFSFIGKALGQEDEKYLFKVL